MTTRERAENLWSKWAEKNGHDCCGFNSDYDEIILDIEAAILAERDGALEEAARKIYHSVKKPNQKADEEWINCRLQVIEDAKLCRSLKSQVDREEGV